MEEESEAFTILLAWEDGDGDSVGLSDRELAFHTIRSVFNE